MEIASLYEDCTKISLDVIIFLRFHPFITLSIGVYD